MPNFESRRILHHERPQLCLPRKMRGNDLERVETQSVHVEGSSGTDVFYPIPDGVRGRAECLPTMLEKFIDPVASTVTTDTA